MYSSLFCGYARCLGRDGQILVLVGAPGQLGERIGLDLLGREHKKGFTISRVPSLDTKNEFGDGFSHLRAVRRW